MIKMAFSSESLWNRLSNGWTVMSSLLEWSSVGLARKNKNSNSPGSLDQQQISRAWQSTYITAIHGMMRITNGRRIRWGSCIPRYTSWKIRYSEINSYLSANSRARMNLRPLIDQSVICNTELLTKESLVRSRILSHAHVHKKNSASRLGLNINKHLGEASLTMYAKRIWDPRGTRRNEKKYSPSSYCSPDRVNLQVTNKGSPSPILNIRYFRDRISCFSH